MINSLKNYEGYIPFTNDITIYLNGGENLQTILEKVEKNVGKIIVPKTAHANESKRKLKPRYKPFFKYTAHS